VPLADPFLRHDSWLCTIHIIPRIPQLNCQRSGLGWRAPMPSDLPPSAMILPNLQLIFRVSVGSGLTIKKVATLAIKPGPSVWATETFDPASPHGDAVFLHNLKPCGRPLVWSRSFIAFPISLILHSITWAKSPYSMIPPHPHFSVTITTHFENGVRYQKR
jgi:hypothetical protein